MDGCLGGPKKIVMELHTDWGLESAQQLKRYLVDSGGDNMHLVAGVDEVLERCEIYRAFDEAPGDPVAATPTVAMSDETLQVDLSFLDDIIAAHVTDVFSKHSLLLLVCTKNPREVSDALCSPRVGVFGSPARIQMDAGGEWKNEIWPELRARRRIKSLFQGVGARRGGLARGMYNRSKEDDRPSGKQIPAEVHWCLNTPISSGGFSAYQTVCRSNPGDLYRWEDRDEDLTFARETAPSGQFVRQWKLRKMAQEAALKKIASSVLHKFLAYNKSSNCTDVKIGDTLRCYRLREKKSTPRWRGPALVLDIDETGAAVGPQSQTSNVARFCARGKWAQRM